MKQSISIGVIVFLIIGSIGIPFIDPWIPNAGIGLNDEINSSLSVEPLELPLKEVVLNSKDYLNQTVTVEGYALFYRCLENTRCVNDEGDFLLSESIENPEEVSIWLKVIDNTLTMPPPNSKILITGEVVFIDTLGGFYRINIRELSILSDPVSPPYHAIELFTDKQVYYEGEEVNLTFLNNGPDDSIVYLPSGAPFTIEYYNTENGMSLEYSLLADQAIIPLAGGESMNWTLIEPEGLKGMGYYKIRFSLYLDESFKEIEFLETKFTIDNQQQRPILDLFTDKIAYNLDEHVILTFKNQGPDSVPVELPNGAPFIIEFQDYETGQLITYSLPAIQILIPVPAGESVNWVLNNPQDTLKGSGYYNIEFRVYVGESLENLFTRFTIGIISKSSDLFTNKEIYNEGENVTLTFFNQGSTPVMAGYCFDIAYRVQKNSPSIILGPRACIEIIIILEPGENISFNIPPSELNGSGFYTITYNFYRAGNPIMMQTEFEIISATTTKTNVLFVPGFEILTAFLAIISLLAVRTRRIR